MQSFQNTPTLTPVLKEKDLLNNQENFLSKEIIWLLNWEKEYLDLETTGREEIKAQLHQELDEEIKGQEEAKEKTIDCIINNLFSLRRKEWPLGVLFFSWNTWTGKTELAKALWKIFLWDKNAITKIECESYQKSHSSMNLFWSPKSYIWYWESSPLNDVNLFSPYEKAKKEWTIHPQIRYLQNFSILIFDEIEKAHPKVHQGLLSIMHDGELTFPTGKEDNPKCKFSGKTDFSNTIIIMTSNIGTQELQNKKNENNIWFNPKSFQIKDEKEIIEKEFKENFSPEFRGRIDNLVFFHPLEKNHCIDILKREIKDINRHFWLLEWDIELKVENEILEKIYEEWYNEEVWWRSIIKHFQKTIEKDINNIINSWKMQEIFELGNQYSFTIKAFLEWEEIKYHLYLKEKKESKKITQNQESDFIKSKHETYIRLIENLSFIDTYKNLNLSPEDENLFYPLEIKTVKKLIEKKIKPSKWKISYEELLQIIEEIEIITSSYIGKNLTNKQTKEIIKIIDSIYKS